MQCAVLQCNGNELWRNVLQRTFVGLYCCVECTAMSCNANLPTHLPSNIVWEEVHPAASLLVQQCHHLDTLSTSSLQQLA